MPAATDTNTVSPPPRPVTVGIASAISCGLTANRTIAGFSGRSALIWMPSRSCTHAGAWGSMIQTARGSIPRSSHPCNMAEPIRPQPSKTIPRALISEKSMSTPFAIRGQPRTTVHRPQWATPVRRGRRPRSWRCSSPWRALDPPKPPVETPDRNVHKRTPPHRSDGRSDRH